MHSLQAGEASPRLYTSFVGRNRRPMLLQVSMRIPKDPRKFLYRKKEIAQRLKIHQKGSKTVSDNPGFLIDKLTVFFFFFEKVFIANSGELQRRQVFLRLLHLLDPSVFFEPLYFWEFLICYWTKI